MCRRSAWSLQFNDASVDGVPDLKRNDYDASESVPSQGTRLGALPTNPTMVVSNRPASALPKLGILTTRAKWEHCRLTVITLWCVCVISGGSVGLGLKCVVFTTSMRRCYVRLGVCQVLSREMHTTVEALQQENLALRDRSEFDAKVIAGLNAQVCLFLANACTHAGRKVDNGRTYFPRCIDDLKRLLLA